MPCAAILNRRFPEIFARREIATLFSFDVPFFRDKRNTGEEGEPGSDQDHEQGFYIQESIGAIVESELYIRRLIFE